MIFKETKLSIIPKKICKWGGYDYQLEITDEDIIVSFYYKDDGIIKQGGHRLKRSDLEWIEHTIIDNFIIFRGKKTDVFTPDVYPDSLISYLNTNVMKIKYVFKCKPRSGHL